MSVITLTGPNDYECSRQLAALTTAFRERYGDLGMERLVGGETSPERLSDALGALPFLAERRLVVLLEGSDNKWWTQKAETLLKDLPESTELICFEPKLDRRTAYYRLLKAKSDFQEFNELEGPALNRWLCEEATRLGGQLSSATADYLITRLGADQRLLASEINKLVIYNPNVSRDSIERLTEPTPQSSIFALLDAAFNGQVARLLQLYREQRAQKVEPPKIIAMLSWQLNLLALVKTAGTRSPAQIAAAARLSPYALSKSQTIARRLSLSELKEIVRQLVSLDRRLKTRAVDADEAVQYFLLRLALA